MRKGYEDLMRLDQATHDDPLATIAQRYLGCGRRSSARRPEFANDAGTGSYCWPSPKSHLTMPISWLKPPAIEGTRVLELSFEAEVHFGALDA
jgi:hypothetical protein